MSNALLETAILKHQQGLLDEAGSLYGQILSVNPQHLDALRLMSMLADQRGDYDAAIQYAQQALAVAPKVAVLHLALANPLLAIGRLPEALAAAQQAFQCDAKSVDALFLLGDIAQQMQDYPAALEWYRKAERLDRTIPELHNNRGSTRMAMGETEEAILCYRKAIMLKPDYTDAHFNLGNAYRAQGDFPAALQAYQETLRYDAAFYKAYVMLGVVLRQLGQNAEAEQAYHTALANLPPMAPERAVALYNLGNLRLAAKDFDQAVAYYRQALVITADDIALLQNLGNALQEQGKAEEVIDIQAHLAKLDPTEVAYRINQAFTLPVLYEDNAEIAQWRQRCEREIDALLADPDLPLAGPHFPERLISTGFYFGYQGMGDKDLQIKVGRLLRKVLGEPSLTMPPDAPQPWAQRGGKVKIGFISRHLSHKHTIGKLLQGVIRHLNRDQFEVHVFSVGTQTAYIPTGDEHPDDCFYELPVRDFEDCRRVLSEAGLDVLYFTDIGMDVLTCLLAHYRFAPVQCTTWGHPVTTASPNMDYFISSQYVETPDAAVHYTETLIPLENYPFYYERPPLETPTLSRADFGLEAGQTIYACVQSIFKLHPDTDTLFINILRRDPNGVLLLLSHPSNACNQQLYDRIARQAPDVVDRVHFIKRLNRTDFLSLLAVSDILLDSIHFSGGNTSYEGLAFGTPIITLETPYMKGRLTIGLYKLMGLMDCVAATPEEYIERAVHYGTNPEARAHLREEILARCPVLYEDLAPVRELETFLLNALQG